MALKWDTRSGNFSDYYSKARFGHLTLTSDDIDGDNEPYSIYIEKKGRNVPIHEKYIRVFSCDAFFGGAEEARRRVEYLARCYFYGITPVYTDWEREKATIHDTQAALQRKPSTQLHGIWVRGIYYHPELNAYIRVESVANIDTQSTSILQTLMGPPSVVFKDAFTDRLYVRTVADFNTLGFKLYSEVEYENSSQNAW